MYKKLVNTFLKMLILLLFVCCTNPVFSDNKTVYSNLDKNNFLDEFDRKNCIGKKFEKFTDEDSSVFSFADNNIEIKIDPISLLIGIMLNGKMIDNPSHVPTYWYSYCNEEIIDEDKYLFIYLFVVDGSLGRVYYKYLYIFRENENGIKYIMKNILVEHYSLGQMECKETTSYYRIDKKNKQLIFYTISYPYAIFEKKTEFRDMYISKTTYSFKKGNLLKSNEIKFSLVKNKKHKSKIKINEKIFAAIAKEIAIFYSKNLEINYTFLISHYKNRKSSSVNRNLLNSLVDIFAKYNSDFSRQLKEYKDFK